MLVREVMTAPVVTVPAGSTIREAVRLLYERNITAAPVLDQRGRMTGIVSEIDLLRGEFEPDPRASVGTAASPGTPPATVEEVMTSDVRTARETDDALELVNLMIRTRVKSVPVVRDGAVIGIVSRRDLMRMLAHGDERIREDVLAALEAAAVGGTATTRVAVRDGIVELYGEDDPPGIADVIARTVPGVVRVVRHR
jgi:CBS domain-containing protein